ncbi:MAG TPA: beta-L-arabinofuranosidase domain-containing protein, partial [Planctomycetota bacterium]|nr:beta-L-arabinofuranosidase domain-containing protein [Planctomycetota bacterium]
MNRSQARLRRSIFELGLLSLLVLAAGDLLAQEKLGDERVSAVRSPPANARTTLYPTSREPLLQSPLVRLPIGSVRARGWLLTMLEMQRDGFHGHLAEISRFLDPETSAWLDPRGRGSHGWEELPYWLKGFGALAYVLDDEELVAQAKTWIDGIIASQKEDGWFGPDEGRRGVATDLEGRADLWPNMIALFCLQDWYEYSGDARVIDLMTRYFRYLSRVPEERFLVGYWPSMRGGDLLMSIYWLHDRTGDPSLLELAAKTHRRSAPWETGLINWHNVNISQSFGEPATWFRQSRSPVHLRAAYRNYDEIRELYGQVPGGMFGGDENCRPGYTGPRQAVETCGMVEMMLSTETLALITGDPLWADRCEDVAFNSLPAALTPDLQGLRYLTAPNHVLSDRASKSPGIQNSGPMYLMSPHDHRCCQHNWGHGWPYLTAHLWAATQDEGLAAVIYSASEVRSKVRGGAEVTIEEETRYPFSEEIAFTVRSPEPSRFPLYLRVPGWCEGARAKVNGQELEVSPRPHDWIRIERTWRSGDRVELRLPMSVKIRRWETSSSSVSIDRGPLTYSLEIGEEWV